MGDTRKKSTKVPEIDTAYVEVARGVFLDGRLALHHPADSWLAISDLHFGYEVSRRRDGGLWPMWGMETIADHLRTLVGRRKIPTKSLCDSVQAMGLFRK